MYEDLDWAHSADHMFDKHRVTVEEATEAIHDPQRTLIDPDYNSQSGRTVRIIGYSSTAGDLLTIIAIDDRGVQYGVNGWRSNSKDRRIYREGADA